MRSAPYLFVLALGALLVAAATETRAAPDDEILTTQIELPRGELRIESHLVTVDITPGFATTTVDQVLVNPQGKDVAAE